MQDTLYLQNWHSEKRRILLVYKEILLYKPRIIIIFIFKIIIKKATNKTVQFLTTQFVEGKTLWQCQQTESLNFEVDLNLCETTNLPNCVLALRVLCSPKFKSRNFLFYISYPQNSNYPENSK